MYRLSAVGGLRSSRRITKIPPRLPTLVSLRSLLHTCPANSFIVVAGIVFQLAAIVVFVILGGDFILRLIADRPYHRKIVEKPAVVEPEQAGDRKRWMIMLATVFFSALMIVMRGIYRTIELLQGESFRAVRDYMLTLLRLERISVR